MTESNPAIHALLASLKSLAALPQDQATAMPPAIYTSKDLLELEQKNIFNAQWLCAGRADSLTAPGHYLTYAINQQPVVIIRQRDSSIRAFANICRHRMMQLLEGTGECPQKRIVCPYHAWTYQIDGQLIGAPYMQERPGFDPKHHSLPEVRCEIWEGFIYVTLHPDIKPVSTLLSDLHSVVGPYRMADYIQIVQEDHIWDTNWKLLTENFMEGYHLPVAHRATIGTHVPLKDTKFSNLPPNAAFTYQSFTKTGTALLGNAHTDNTWLAGDQRRTSILPTVFPSHMYSLAPDHLWYLSLQPLGTDKVQIRYGAALAPEVLNAATDPEQLKRDIITFLTEVNEEDRYVVEGIMKGANAPLSTPGPLCWLERENHEFTQYLAHQLT